MHLSGPWLGWCLAQGSFFIAYRVSGFSGKALVWSKCWRHPTWRPVLTSSIEGGTEAKRGTAISWGTVVRLDGGAYPKACSEQRFHHRDPTCEVFYFNFHWCLEKYLLRLDTIPDCIYLFIYWVFCLFVFVLRQSKKIIKISGAFQP